MPNAKELIEFAIDHKLDSVQLNTMKPFETQVENYLENLCERFR
jgi:hypothetical protein